MPVVDFNEQDILRGKVVDPGWYRIRIGSFSEVPTKDGNSTNYVYDDCMIIRNEDTGSEDFAGVPIKILFSAKPTAKGFLTGFFKALGGDLQPGARFRLEDAQGKEVIAFVENNVFQGNVSNRINHRYKKVE